MTKKIMSFVGCAAMLAAAQTGFSQTTLEDSTTANYEISIVGECTISATG